MMIAYCLHVMGPVWHEYHVFSTAELRQAFIDAEPDDRAFVTVDYLVDHPERYRERHQ
jgi:hypothetical protein